MVQIRNAKNESRAELKSGVDHDVEKSAQRLSFLGRESSRGDGVPSLESVDRLWLCSVAWLAFRNAKRTSGKKSHDEADKLQPELVET
jgi:hypothetical protein